MTIAATTMQPSAASTITLVSASGKRMYPRVDIPLVVEFENGEQRDVKDWSVAGLSLADGPVAKDGAIHHVRLRFGLRDCEVVLPLDAKVSRTSGGEARAYRFVGLTPDQARILDHFLQSGLEGDSAVVGGLPIAQQPTVAGRRPGVVRRVGRTTFQIGKLVVLIGLVAGGATLVLSRFLTVTSDYAAVAAGLQQLHAPEAGFLRSDALAVGAHLTKNQTIGTMQPVATPQARLATATEIASLQTTLDQQTAALAQSREGFATFLQTARTDLAEATEAREALEQQVAAENKIFGRVVTMQQSGIVAEERLDQEQQVVLNLKRTLSAARDTEASMHQKLVNAEAGRFTSDGRSTQKSPADLEQEAQVTAATIQRLKAMLAALDEPLAIVSPCDCTVTALAATPGTYVAAGAHLADLARRDEGAASIDALVQTSRLSLVRQGQAVTVYLASRPDGVPGHITAVNFDPANTGRTGLPTTLRTLDDYGLMTVALDSPVAAMPTGLPVSVMAPVGWRALVANTPAAAWLASVLADLPAEMQRAFRL